MPKSALARKENVSLLINIFGVLIIIIFLSALMDLGIFTYNQKLNSDVLTLNNEIAALNSEENEANTLKLIGKKIEYKENLLKEIDENSTSIYGLMNQIEAITPTDVSIDNLSVDKEGNVSIKGKADKEESVLDMFHSLKAGEFAADSITFNNIAGTVGDVKGFEFSFSFKLKGRK